MSDSDVVPPFKDIQIYTKKDVDRVKRVQALFRGRRLRTRIEEVREAREEQDEDAGDAVRLLLLIDAARHQPSTPPKKEEKTVSIKRIPGVLAFGASISQALHGFKTVFRFMTVGEKFSLFVAVFLMLVVTAYLLWLPSWVSTVLAVFFYDSQGELSITTLFGWIIVYSLIASLAQGFSWLAFRSLELRLVGRTRELFGMLYFNNMDVITRAECGFMDDPLDKVGETWFHRVPAFWACIANVVASFIIVIIASSFRLGLMTIAGAVTLIIFTVIGNAVLSARKQSEKYLLLLQEHVRGYSTTASNAPEAMNALYRQQMQLQRRGALYDTAFNILQYMLRYANIVIFVYLGGVEVNAGRMTSFSFALGFFYFVYLIVSLVRLGSAVEELASLGNKAGPAVRMLGALQRTNRSMWEQKFLELEAIEEMNKEAHKRFCCCRRNRVSDEESKSGSGSGSGSSTKSGSGTGTSASGAKKKSKKGKKASKKASKKGKKGKKGKASKKKKKKYESEEDEEEASSNMWEQQEEEEVEEQQESSAMWGSTKESGSGDEDEDESEGSETTKGSGSSAKSSSDGSDKKSKSKSSSNTETKRKCCRCCCRSSSPSKDSAESDTTNFQALGKMGVPWVAVFMCILLVFGVVAIIVATCRVETFLRCENITVQCSSSTRSQFVTQDFAQHFSWTAGCLFDDPAAVMLDKCATALQWDRFSAFPVRASWNGWRIKRGFSGTLEPMNGNFTSNPVFSRRHARSVDFAGSTVASHVLGSIDAFFTANNAPDFTPPTHGMEAIYANTEREGVLTTECGRPLTTKFYRFTGVQGRTAVFKVTLQSLDRAVLTLYNSTTQLMSQLQNTPTGPQISTVLPTSGQYYLAVSREILTTYSAAMNYTFLIKYSVDIGITPIPPGLAPGYIGMEWHSVGTDYSWIASQYYCALTFGQGLCTAADVCNNLPAAASSNPANAPFAPVSNGGDQWVQLTTGSTCGSSITTSPVWSDFSSKLRFRGTVACCNSTQGILSNTTKEAWYMFLAEGKILHYVTATPLANAPTLTVSIYSLAGGPPIASAKTIVTYTPENTEYILVRVDGMALQSYAVSYSTPVHTFVG